MPFDHLTLDRSADSRLAGCPAAIHPRNDIAMRRFAMYLMNENLARAHMDDLHAEARRAQLASRVARAHRLKRRAEHYALRASRANAQLG